MNFNLMRLRNGIDKQIKVNEKYTFQEEQLKKYGVSKLEDVIIEGEITLNPLKELYLSLNVKGTMIIPCAITLKPVSYPFDIVIEGDLSEISDGALENSEKYINSIDILPIIWENILMEIPMRVVSEDVKETKMSGDGWRLITDEEEHINPQLAGLKDLLQDSEVR